MPKVCPVCGTIVSNLRKHLSRGRCSKQHIRKKKDKEMKQPEMKGYEHFPIPRPEPDIPQPDEDDDEEEEDLIPTYKGEENEKS